MRQVWIGCSRVLQAGELIRRYIDPFDKVPAAFLDLKNQAGEVPGLVRSFGASVIDLGGFEVNGKSMQVRRRSTTHFMRSTDRFVNIHQTCVPRTLEICRAYSSLSATVSQHAGPMASLSLLTL